MPDPTRALAAAAAVLAVLVAGCTSDDSETAPPRQSAPESPGAPTGEQPSPPAGSAEPTAPTPGDLTPPTQPADGPEVPRAQSLQAVMAKEYPGGRVDVLRQVADYGAYTRSEVRYRSDGVWVSGVLHVPRGKGPFPALVLAHGYIEPASYVTGQGMSREMDYLARNGYVVLHTDYRGHASSGAATGLARETRLGYTEDVITAVQAVKRLPYVDRSRVGLMGRSMGGGVVYNVLVAKPGLVDAAVVYAPVSSRFLDNFNRWTRPERPDVAEQVFERLGTPAQEPAVYRDLSARTFFDRVTEPVLIHHGTADESCPLRWSKRTYGALTQAGVDARLEIYPGEPHAFIADWQLSIRRSAGFLGRQL